MQCQITEHHAHNYIKTLHCHASQYILIPVSKSVYTYDLSLWKLNATNVPDKQHEQDNEGKLHMIADSKVDKNMCTL